MHHRTIDSDSDDGSAYSPCSMDDYADDDKYAAAASTSTTSFGRIRPLSAADELPIFRCRSISPIDPRHDDGGDTLFNFSMSPCGSIGDLVDNDDELLVGMDDEIDDDDNTQQVLEQLRNNCFDRISLEEIHARMSGDGSTDDSNDPESTTVAADSASSPQTPTPAVQRLKLETIVEGVFLETPPRGRLLQRHGAWRVATQSIGQFVEDQRRRRYEAIVLADDDDGAFGMEMDDDVVDCVATTMAEADDVDDEDEDFKALALNAGSVVVDAAIATSSKTMPNNDVKVDRLLNRFQQKLNMC